MQAQLVDRIRGVIYGQAVADALGLGTEFLNRAQVQAYYPNGLSHYGGIVKDGHRSRWTTGDWTDDTDQLLCIFDSLLDQQRVEPTDIAARLRDWMVNGGMGIGQTVAAVLRSPDFLQQPHQAAERIWIQSGRNVAANGGVMRTAILGVWDFGRPEQVRLNAEAACRVTHYDPRCVGSCVIVSRAISAMLRGTTDVDALLREARELAVQYDSRIIEYFDRAAQSLTALELDEGLDINLGQVGSIGYTLKALGAGLWALQHAPSYWDGISAVIHEGGDSDSNAAVAGALLGARFGFSGIPARLVDWLVFRDQLEERIARLLPLLQQQDADQQ